MNEKLNSPKQASEKLGIGITRLYQLINSGDLEAIKFGKLTRIKDSTIQEFVESLPTYKKSTEV